MNDINQEHNEADQEPEIISQPILKPKRKLYKSYQNVILSGVCGGLGEYFHLHPIFIRLIFVILAFLGGWGIVFYVILSLLLPKNPLVEKKFLGKIDFKRLAGFLMLLVGAYYFFNLQAFGLFNLFSFTDTIIFPFILGAIGIWILMKGESKFSTTPVIKTKKLYRSRKYKLVLGLCGGIADYMNTDANLVRLFWVLLSFITLGLGVVLYFFFGLLTQPIPGRTNEE